MSVTENLEAAERPPTRPADASPNPVNWVVFIGSLVGILVIAGWCFVAPAQAEAKLGEWVAATSAGFGWFYIALATAVVVFVIFLAVSRYGDVRLGPDHAKPQYTTFSWAAMLFAAGIGTDLMFFSVAEPVTQYLTPPRIQGQTIQAANEATVWTLFHYGITGWAMYSLMGLALAYFAYRRHQPLAVRSALAPLFGRHLDGPLGHIVDIAAILGTIFGVATSLGIGVVSLSVGLDMLFHFGAGLPVQIALVVIAVVMAAVSATTGVDKGIRFLSQLNVILAIGIAGWVLVTGDTTFLLNALVQNIGDFVAMFPSMTAQTFAYDQPAEWMSLWTLFFWAWWIAWASFVGLFLARISQGRTIRQFVTGTLVLPFSYIVMWVSIFGNSAIERIRGGDSAFGKLASEVPEMGFYTLLQQYPGATFLIGIATFVGLLFYVTSADSGALVMANLCSRLATPYDDGRPWLRIVWAAATGVLTVAMLAVGGIVALQNATVIMGVPFAIVMALVILGLYRALRVELDRTQSGQHRLPRMFSGRSGSDRDGHLAQTWRARLDRAVENVSEAEALACLEGVVVPALDDVAEALAERGVAATVSRESWRVDTADPRAAHVELRTDGDDETAFVYRVEIDEVPVPVLAGRMVTGHPERTARLEVHVAGSGQGYDLMGYTQAQVIHDVLDQYERHLEFLRIRADAPTV